MRSGLALLLGVLLSACTPFGLTTVAPRASATPDPTATVQVMPTLRPSPSPVATATPSPSPVPTPDPSAMDLTATSCNGGVVLRWSPSAHPEFHHYIGLRSPEDDIAPGYPPIAPAVDWGDLYATDRFVTTGFDATVVPSSTTWHYRVMAYDVAGRVVSSSGVASARILEHRELGPVSAATLDGGQVELSWDRFDGVPECFGAYRVLVGTNGVAGTLLASVSDPDTVSLVTDALHPGVSYAIRVQAVHTTTLGHFVMGESEILTFAVPHS